jgi:hypothetical protein
MFFLAKADTLGERVYRASLISKFPTILQYLPFSAITVGAFIHERSGESGR